MAFPLAAFVVVPVVAVAAVEVEQEQELVPPHDAVAWAYVALKAAVEEMGYGAGDRKADTWAAYHMESRKGGSNPLGVGSKASFLLEGEVA